MTPENKSQSHHRYHRPQAVISVGIGQLLLLAAVVAGVFWLTGLSGPDTKKGADTNVSVGQAPRVISIPVLNISASVTLLDVKPDKTLQVPAEFGQVGWYKKSARPGEAGNSIMVGHYDSLTGPAVFYELKNLKAGDQIEIMAADGAKTVYEVEKMEEYPRENYPNEKVYGSTDYGRLTLITCSGVFMPQTDNYTHNLVVYANLVKITP